MTVNTRRFFYHYTRRFFSFKITLAVFFVRITRDVFFRDDAIITRDVFSMQYYTRRFFRHVVKHGLDSLVKYGLDPISKTWTRLVKHGLD